MRTRCERSFSSAGRLRFVMSYPSSDGTPKRSMISAWLGWLPRISVRLRPSSSRYTPVEAMALADRFTSGGRMRLFSPNTGTVSGRASGSLA